MAKPDASAPARAKSTVMRTDIIYLPLCPFDVFLRLNKRLNKTRQATMPASMLSK
jgi:hypothetical protein